MAKLTVEKSFILDALAFSRGGGLRPGDAGSMHWTLGDRVVFVLVWRVEPGDYLHIHYATPGVPGAEPGSSWILIQRTPSPVGGERPWFVCGWCERRVRKLYLPLSRERFGCRTCHALTYHSRLRRIPPWQKAFLRAEELERQLLSGSLTPRQSRRAEQELDALEKALQAAGIYHAWHRLLHPPPEPPRRPRGRPSKKVERERAQAERDAARAASVKRPRGRPKEKRPYTPRTERVRSQRTTDTQAHCVKCRGFREMVDPRPVTFKNGRSALQGPCAVCGTKISRIVKSRNAGLEPAGVHQAHGAVLDPTQESTQSPRGRPAQEIEREPAPAEPAAVAKRARGRPKEKRPYARSTERVRSVRTTDTQAHCVKCRGFREMVDPQPVTFKNGRPALQGPCEVCGTKIGRIVKAE